MRRAEGSYRSSPDSTGDRLAAGPGLRASKGVAREESGGGVGSSFRPTRVPIAVCTTIQACK